MALLWATTYTPPAASVPLREIDDGDVPPFSILDSMPGDTKARISMSFADIFEQRASLLLRDTDRLEAIINHPEMPVQFIFAGGARLLGKLLWKGGDQFAIDGVAVNGSAHGVGRLAGVMRYLQTGLINHYAIAMIIGLIGLVYWFALR